VSAAAWVAVGVVGGLAAGARVLLDAEISRRIAGPFPTGILAVNLLGSLALGALAASGVDGQWLIVLAGGAIGSFTTFSTWMLDTQQLSAGKRGGLAWLNIGLPLAAGFLAVALGHWLAGL
jgi:fluoride exporter